jgi:hypothetical protein
VGDGQVPPSGASLEIGEVAMQGGQVSTDPGRAI